MMFCRPTAMLLLVAAVEDDSWDGDGLDIGILVAVSIEMLDMLAPLLRCQAAGHRPSRGRENKNGMYGALFEMGIQNCGCVLIVARSRTSASTAKSRKSSLIGRSSPVRESCVLHLNHR